MSLVSVLGCGTWLSLIEEQLYYELVKVLGGDKSNISHSLRTLEERGWIVILRTPGGQANSIDLTPEGLKNASEI